MIQFIYSDKYCTHIHLMLILYHATIIRVRIAWQMAGWKARNDNSSTTISERWRNAGPSTFQLQASMLKS